GEFLAEYGEQGAGQACDPGEDQEQPDAHEHGHEQPGLARDLTPLLGELVDQYRDEDDVVDAQHELERGEGRERDPGLRVGEDVDHRDFFSLWTGSDKAAAATFSGRATGSA